MRSCDISDHHYIQEIAEFEWKKAKRLKLDKGYMGKMAFPENSHRPARTVMATISFSARESMIFAYKINRFRAPSIREIACLMSFPIDYRFYGESIGIKYQLVGNAVPPKMSYAFALAIAQQEGIKTPSNYIPLDLPIVDDEFKNLNWQYIPMRKEISKHKLAKFKYHIPYLINKTFRVELTNHHSDFKAQRFRWDVEIHKSQGPRAKIYYPIISDGTFSSKEYGTIIAFIQSIKMQLSDFNNFQKIYCMTEIDRSTTNSLGPYELLDHLRTFLDHFDKAFDCSKEIQIDQEPFLIPRLIVTGYFILGLTLREMEKI